MQGKANGIFRGVMTGAIALGFMGTAALSTSVAAQDGGVICYIEPALELADQNGDGTVTIAEIDRVINLSGGNADLQAARDAAVAAGVTGIQYTGCTPDDDNGETPGGDNGETPGGDNGETPGGDNGETPGGDNGETPGGDNGETPGGDNGETPGGDNGETPGGDNGETPGGDNGETPGGDNGSGTDDGVTELPDTGAGVAESNSTSWIMMGAGSLMAAAGAFIFRTKKA